MKKAHTAFSRSLFLSVFTLVGCGFKGNTNMQTELPLNNPKQDAVFRLFGLPNRSDIENFSTENLIDNLGQPPTNTSPTKNNQKEYKKITESALKYVIENITKSEATEIVRIQKFVDVLKDAGFDDSYYNEKKENEQNFIAIPFTEKGSDGKTVDLSAYQTRTGINADSKFKVYGTKNGKIDKNIFAAGTVYLFTYKLKNSDTNHSAIITVPDDLSENKPLPLILYAHGGDSGVSFRNIAQIMQSTLSQGIVAAPSFPGEAICAITTLGGLPGKPENLLRRSCGDANDKFEKPLIKDKDKKSPLDEDVSSLIGLHNAITKLALTTDPTKQKIKFTSNTIDQEFNTKIKYLSFNSKTSLIPFLNSPQALGVAESRGGATLLAAIGRIGIYYQDTFTQLLKAPKLDLEALHKIPKLPLLSGAALYYSPSSLLMGELAIPLQNMLNGDLFDQSSYNMFPMVPDLNKNKFFTDYRNASNDNHEQELNNLAGWLAASDMTFLGPYVSVAVQNWTYTIDSISQNFDTNLKAQMADPENSALVEALTLKSGTPSTEAIIQQLPALAQVNKELSTQAVKVIKNIFTKSITERKSAPGSIILLHATHDQVVPYSQSLITKNVLDKVFDAVHNEANDLTKFRIPPVGAQLFAFQPENKFYNLPMNKLLLNGSKICGTSDDKDIKKDGTTFNAQTKSCIGEKTHSDAAFATSTLINESVNQITGNAETQLQSILTQGIPGANTPANTLTIINGNYAKIKEKLSTTIQTLNQNINTLQQQENTDNIATRKNIRKALTKAQKELTKVEKEHNYLDQAKLKTICENNSRSNNITGVCYLKNGPQFHRPLYLDLAQKDSLIDKKWDNTAATAQSPLTPSDVLTAWFASSAKEVLTK